MWVKLCGLRTEADLYAAVSAGADAVGFVPVDSPRRVDDAAALSASSDLCRTEGIILELETAHPLAGAREIAREHPGSRILVGLSGRGDKDLPSLRARESKSRGMNPSRDELLPVQRLEQRLRSPGPGRRDLPDWRATGCRVLS